MLFHNLVVGTLVRKVGSKNTLAVRWARSTNAGVDRSRPLALKPHTFTPTVPLPIQLLHPQTHIPDGTAWCFSWVQVLVLALVLVLGAGCWCWCWALLLGAGAGFGAGALEVWQELEQELELELVLVAMALAAGQ